MYFKFKFKYINILFKLKMKSELLINNNIIFNKFTYK